MRVASSYYKGVSACVANLARGLPASQAAVSVQNLTSGYASTDGHNVFDPFATCGASGPVGFVAFFSGSLFWINAGFAVVLYIKRDEIVSGIAPGSSNQHDYDEIGVETDINRNEFSGDFPLSAAAGTRTMHV